jgi:beta-N-acetylhexosaminidase
MLDLVGLEISPEERDMLTHPLVGGVILFSRNYESPEQLQHLVSEIHNLREPHLLVAVDHEGGRVQRFRQGFSEFPPAAVFGKIYDEDRKRGKRLAESCGWLMAVELRALGIDFSFAPVLDLDFGISTVIGDRAFHRKPDAVADLAQSYMMGMRRFEEIYRHDVVPFGKLIRSGLGAIMPAHVIYPAVDEKPACFSSLWLKEVLRGRMGFQGVIFSDDLTMKGAHVMGDIVERGVAAMAAGCDMVLVCNQPEEAVKLIDGLSRRDDTHDDPVSHVRLARMHERHNIDRNELLQDPKWKEAVRVASDLRGHESGELEV